MTFIVDCKLFDMTVICFGYKMHCTGINVCVSLTLDRLRLLNGFMCFWDSDS